MPLQRRFQSFSESLLMLNTDLFYNFECKRHMFWQGYWFENLYFSLFFSLFFLSLSLTSTSLFFSVCLSLSLLAYPLTSLSSIKMFHAVQNCTAILQDCNTFLFFKVTAVFCLNLSLLSSHYMHKGKSGVVGLGN